MGLPVFVEDEIGRKWDRCLTDAILKLGGGLFLGGMFSILFFKRKKWPVLVGSGFGLGMAYTNCERDINASVTAVAYSKVTREKCSQ